MVAHAISEAGLIICPKCDIAIGETSESHRVFSAVCAQCEYHYVVFTAQLTSSSSNVNWGFRLDLDVPGAERQSFQHRSRKARHWADQRIGQWLGVVATVHRNGLEDVICMWAKGEPAVQVSSPGGRGRRIAWWTTLSASLVILLIGGFGFAAWLAAAAAGAAIYWGIGRLRIGRVRLHEDERARIRATQALLQRKLDFHRAATNAVSEAARKSDLARELLKIIDNMKAVDESLYANRIERLRRGAQLLLEQSNKQIRLGERYSRAIKMTDIEMQTRRAAERLGQELPKITAPDEELEALHEEIKQLDRELAANEEVEQVLGKSLATAESATVDNVIPPIPPKRRLADIYQRRPEDDLDES